MWGSTLRKYLVFRSGATFKKNKMAARLSLGGFGFQHQLQSYDVSFLFVNELLTQTKLLTSYTSPLSAANLELEVKL